MIPEPFDPSPAEARPALRTRRGRLLSCREVRGDCSVWEVEVEGRKASAVAYASLCGALRVGDEVLLNTTAVELSLGTGGVHFVISRGATSVSVDEQAACSAFPGREAGHILKLRYTPLQHRVLAAEEEASPHRESVLRFAGLEGVPVLAAELHSQAGAAAVAARAAAPELRIVLIQLDSAALPLAFSRLAERLRADGVVNVTVTVGQSFGGDLEAVNVYSGLAVAEAVADAELILVTQGPGNVGTGTEYGFSGMSLVEALHAAELLGGLPALAARLSEADPRPRHRGLSHHTQTVLRAARVPVVVPWPQSSAADGESIRRRMPRHQFPEVPVSAAETVPSNYRNVLTTMGRSLDEDPLFFDAACAAGWWAAQTALARGRNRLP